MVDSSSIVHTEHLSSFTTFLLVKFTAVGKISRQALHANTLNEGDLTLPIVEEYNN